MLSSRSHFDFLTRRLGITRRALACLRTSRGGGFIGPFHLYFDDLFPYSIGKPLRGTPRMRLLAASVLLASLAGLSPAFAHAFLVKAEPAVGSTVVNGKPQAVPGHGNEMAVPLHITAPGRYSVTWHAVAVDTHHTQGSFGFTVSP
jgi:copper resistance protein C